VSIQRGHWLTRRCSSPYARKIIARLIANTDYGARLVYRLALSQLMPIVLSSDLGSLCSPKLPLVWCVDIQWMGVWGILTRSATTIFVILESRILLTMCLRMDGGFCDASIRMELQASYSHSSSDLLDSIRNGPAWSLDHPRGGCGACIF
jgi:hypothetical protein